MRTLEDRLVPVELGDVAEPLKIDALPDEEELADTLDDLLALERALSLQCKVRGDEGDAGEPR